MGGTVLATPSPRDVAGYEAAKSHGRVPVVTTLPPPVLPGPSAARRLTALLGSMGVFAIAFVALLATASSAPLSNALLTPVTVAGVVLVLLQVPGLRRRQYAELQHGYTTVPVQFGYTQGERRRQSALSGHRLVWNYAGTWFLRSDGGVRRAPDASLDAPGFYPSPSGGAYELWTGSMWAGRRATT